MLSAGLCACGGGGDPAATGGDTSTGLVDPTSATTTPTDATSTEGSRTTGDGASGTGGTDTGTSPTTGDGTSGTDGASTTSITTGGTGSGPGSSSATDTEASSSSGTSMGETAGLDGACGPAPGNDPTPWSVHLGAPGEYMGVATVGARSGSVVYTTNFDAILDLGGGPIDPAGASHVLVASHAPSGALQWADHVGGPPQTTNIHGFDAATDCAGNVVLAGTFHGEITVQRTTLTAVPGVEFDDGMSFPTVDWFVIKFGPDGALLWARRFGDLRSQRLRGVGVQIDGAIVVAGDVQGTMDLGGPPIVTAGPYPDTVLAALDPSGVFLWQRHVAGTKGTQFWRVDVGPDDRIAVLASATGAVDLGGGVLPYTGTAWVLAQYAADGAHRWSHRWQHPAHMPSHLAADASGGVLVGGYSVPGDDTFPGFVVRHDAEGVFQWEHVFLTAPNSPDRVVLSVLAADHEVAVLGTLYGTFDFGGGPLSAVTPPTSMFVARFDLAGGHLESAVFDATQEQVPFAAAYGPDGELVSGGIFQGTFDLGAGPMVNVGAADMFVHRFGP